MVVFCRFTCSVTSLCNSASFLSTKTLNSTSSAAEGGVSGARFSTIGQ